MNDGYVYVNPNKRLDPWYRGLDRNTQIVFDHLTAHPSKSRTGIIEETPEMTAFYCQMTVDEAEGALEGLVRGLRIIREGHFIFVKGFVRVQFNYNPISANDNRVPGICRELDRFSEHCPSLVSEFVTLYFSHLPEAPWKPLGSPLEAPPEGLPVSITIPSTNTSTNSSATSSPSPDVSASPILGERELEIFDQCIAAIAEKTSHKTANSNPKTSQKKFKQVVEIDKVPLGDVLPALKWALGDDFWQDKLFGIVGWRKDGGNGPKFWQMWRKWKAQRAQERPKVKDPRTVAFFAQRGVTEPTDADWAAWREHLAATRSAPVVDAPSVKPWELRKQQEAEIHQQRAEEARRKIADEHQVD